MSKLKPCPHCGGEASLFQSNVTGDDYYVRCEECDCGTMPHPTKKHVIDAWNTRHVETCHSGNANGGTVHGNDIRPSEEGSICPVPRASVIFEGQKLTFDEEDSERLRELVEGHFRKLAGLEGEE